MNLKNFAIVAVLLLGALASQATNRKVLFIGNSYTYTNTMPAMLQSFAAAKGDTLVFDQSDPGGYTLAQHCVDATTISKIFSQQWDIVVIQEQSQLPSFPPDQVDTGVYPYAHRLDSMIHVNDVCTQTMFMMTWGHANGDPSNCAFYPVICTYNGMQERLRESYLQMTMDNHAVVAPVGVAWKMVRDSVPALGLYQADDIHPVVAGSYLQTSVLYGSIFHKKATGCTYLDGLSAADAHTLQHFADKAVFDSFTYWQQYGHYPSAAFTYSASGIVVAFTGNNPVAASDYWSFGDAATSTVSVPVHTYSGTGNYVVRHTVSNSCFTETITDTLHLGTTGVNNIAAGDKKIVGVQQDGNGNVSFILPADNVYNTLEVYNSRGQLVRKFSPDRDNVTTRLVPGLYVYRAFSQQKNIVYTGKLVVY